jgi:type II secretory ATPase GspE/PulE/Tfp pilus assembly ATPase PilB-like protein
MSVHETNTTDELAELDFEELSGEVELNLPEEFARALIGYAAELKANDIFVSDDSAATSVKLRQLGKIREIRRLTRDYGRRLQNHFRALSGTDSSDSHRPSEGRCLFQVESQGLVDLRINSLPSLFGQDLAIRIADQGAGVARLGELGMRADEQHRVRRLLDSPSGLILVAGPTGSGKTHSLYSFLEYLNDGQRKIHTLEDPIERVLQGVVQSQVTRRPGMDFSDLLSAVLRHSPDVIMVGEVRDERTAEIALRAASSGQLVLATIHAQTAAGAIDTMLAYKTHRHFLASTLVGVVAQRLVRRVCAGCRRYIELPLGTSMLADTREQLGSSTPRLSRPVGCEICRGSGYDRMICIPEILIGTSRVRTAVGAGAITEDIEAIAVESGMRTLRKAAQIRIAEGTVTPEDVYQALPPQLE